MQYNTTNAAALIAGDGCPTVTAIRMRAVVNGTSYQQAHIDGLRQWHQDIEDQIEARHQEVAQWRSELREATSYEYRFAIDAEITHLLAALAKLWEAHAECARMLADADVNPIDPRPVSAPVAMSPSV